MRFLLFSAEYILQKIKEAPTIKPILPQEQNVVNNFY
jgi:hypothetical protein